MSICAHCSSRYNSVVSASHGQIPPRTSPGACENSPKSACNCGKRKRFCKHFCKCHRCTGASVGSWPVDERVRATTNRAGKQGNYGSRRLRLQLDGPGRAATRTAAFDNVKTTPHVGRGCTGGGFSLRSCGKDQNLVLRFFRTRTVFAAPQPRFLKGCSGLGTLFAQPGIDSFVGAAKTTVWRWPPLILVRTCPCTILTQACRRCPRASVH